MNETERIFIDLNGYKVVISNVNKTNKLLENNIDTIESFDNLLSINK